MTVCVLRILAAMTSVVAVAAVWEIAQLGGERGVFWSGLAIAGYAGSALLGLAALGMAVAPTAAWTRILGKVHQWITWLPTTSVPRAGTSGVVLILCGHLTYVVLISQFLPLQTAPDRDDQADYLRVARQVHEAGGLPALMQQLYRGEFEEANRHPLFIGVLSYWPTFYGGKLLSATIGFLSLTAISVLVWRRFGPLTAGLSCVLLATNFAYCYATTVIVCEGMLVLFSSLAWLTTCDTDPGDRAASSRKLADSSRARTRGFQLVGVGCLLGLTYLTKGTGLLLLIGFLGFQILIHLGVSVFSDDRRNSQTTAAEARRQIRFDAPGALKSVACVLIGWLIVSSPLLVRNSIRFGHPVYNHNSYLLFADEATDPALLVRKMPVGEAAERYFQTHSAADILKRESAGLAWESFIITRSLGPVPLDDSRVLVGVLLLPLAVAGMLAERRRDALLIGIWFVLFLLMFSWYVPIAASERFVLPLLGPILVYASCGALHLAAGLIQPTSSGRFGTITLAAGLCWCGTWIAGTCFTESLKTLLQ